MPNTKSAKKRMRQGEGRRLRNREQRSTLRTALKRVHAAGTSAEAQDAYRSAEQMLDRAARKHLVHRNLAARTKARLRKLIQSKS